MNKRLLYICIVSFLYLACAKERTEDSLFIEPFAEEESIISIPFNNSNPLTALQDSLKVGLDNVAPGFGKAPSKETVRYQKSIPKKESSPRENLANELDGNKINKTKSQKPTAKLGAAPNAKDGLSQGLKNDSEVVETISDSMGLNATTSSQKTDKVNAETENPRNKTVAFEPKITPLFTDASAHNKSDDHSSVVVKNQIDLTNQTTDGSINTREWASQTSTNPAIGVRVLKKEITYQTNRNYTLLVEVLNNGDPMDSVNLNVMLPNDWKIISISKLGTLNKDERKLCMLSFHIPAQSPSGSVSPSLVLTRNNQVLKTHDFELKVSDNYDLEVFTIATPQQLQSGELIEASFGIKNKGNVAQKVALSSRNTINGAATLEIPKDSIVIVQVTQETNAKAETYRKISANLEVQNLVSEKKYYSSESIEVIPTKIKQKDPYFRYPMDASLYFSSYTKEKDHYSTVSAELRGNGYLDVEKDHHLNFIIRAPKKENLRRFSVVDQYSLIYRYKNKTTLYLGDHSYYNNRLGFGSRYGMGFKVDHNINRWALSAFYSKPRLYSFNEKPLYGVKAVFHKSDSLNIGLTLERSNGSSYNYANSVNHNGKGQIVTLDYDFTNKNTHIEGEVSTSFNNKSVDYATDLNVIQSFKNISLSSYLILTGKNYLGNISNSLQLINRLNYNNDGLNLGLGHSVSKVNRRLDPILFEAEPYYESYFATLGYRFDSKHYVNFRFDSRVREDQLKPRNYYYKEYGLNYNFNYTNKLFTGSIGGRFAKTQNMLIENQNYRNTYSHHLNVSYKILNNFDIRAGLNHLYTNRYGQSDLSYNYIRYNFGINYNLKRDFSLNVNYNSGYSPEESFKRRDYINVNLRAQINNHHRFEIWANYFENPGVNTNKELFAYAKYTYSFGVGVKRLFDRGGIDGHIMASNSEIAIKGIKIYTAGKTIVTDTNGNFELNNLELGTNYIYIDEASLPLNVVSKQKNPIEVIVDKDRKAILDIQLVKSGSLYGQFNLKNKEKAVETNMSSYIKLENEAFIYYTEANENGAFRFQNIVPGDYTFTLIRFKSNVQPFSVIKHTNVTIEEALNTELEIAVKGKERKIKFKDTNFKIATKQ